MKNNVSLSVDPQTRLCSECNEKPPMSNNCPYCASCMAKRSNIKRLKKATKEQSPPEPLGVKKNLTVYLDFVGHTDLHDRLKEMAKDELRSLENQMIYILKNHVNELAGGNIGR